MSDARKQKPAPEPTIHCLRVDAIFTVAQHKDCPYCFGKVADVATGRHRDFCDFQPGKDPIVFGFPDDKGRHTQS